MKKLLLLLFLLLPLSISTSEKEKSPICYFKDKNTLVCPSGWAIPNNINLVFKTLKYSYIMPKMKERCTLHQFFWSKKTDEQVQVDLNELTKYYNYVDEERKPIKRKAFKPYKYFVCKEWIKKIYLEKVDARNYQDVHNSIEYYNLVKETHPFPDNLLQGFTQNIGKRTYYNNLPSYRAVPLESLFKISVEFHEDGNSHQNHGL